MPETEPLATTTTASHLKSFYLELTEVEMPESVVHTLMAEAGHCLMGDGQIAVRRVGNV